MSEVPLYTFGGGSGHSPGGSACMAAVFVAIHVYGVTSIDAVCVDSRLGAGRTDLEPGFGCVQGYLAHKKTSTTLRPPQDPRHRPTVGS